jgi:hypothetical protein
MDAAGSRSEDVATPDAPCAETMPKYNLYSHDIAVQARRQGSPQPKLYAVSTVSGGLFTKVRKRCH